MNPSAAPLTSNYQRDTVPSVTSFVSYGTLFGTPIKARQKARQSRLTVQEWLNRRFVRGSSCANLLCGDARFGRGEAASGKCEL